MNKSSSAGSLDFLDGLTTQDTSLIETIPVGLAVVDHNGRIAYVNEHAARIFASSKAAMMGRNAVSLLPEDLRVSHAAAFRAGSHMTRQIDMSAPHELRARTDDGRDFPIEITLRPVRFGGRVATLATIADVSDRRDYDEALRQVFESAANGLALVTTDGVITRTNARFNKKFGYRAEELIGQKIEILVPHRFRDAHAPLRQTYSAAPSTRSMGMNRDLTGRRKDGVEFPLEIGLSSFETHAGRLICVSVVDITQRKRSELKLREAHAQLEEFTYVVAHDLRSPMRGVVNLIDFITEDLGAEAPPSALKNLQRMRDRTTNVERMIEDLLTYARAGRRGATFETIKLAEIVSEILASHNFPEGLRLEVEVASQEFAGARTPLATVIRNLISNAVNHHDKSEMHIRVRSRDEGDYVAIDVIDDGPGIPEAMQERVFRLFQTLAGGEKKGSGLGLAVAQRLVKGHGGQIALISADDVRGCTFRVWWPRIVRSDLDE